LLRSSSSRSTFGFQSPLRLQPDLLRRLLRYGIPNGFQMMLEGLAFTIFVIAIGQLGTAATAATTLAISINIVAFVPMMGVGIAVTTLVGNYLGSDRPDLAARASRSGLALALAYNLVFAVLYLAVPHWFMRMHEFGAAADDFATIQSLAIVMLRFVAAYCLFDATQLIFCSAIKGAGDTRFVMITTLVTSTAAILLGKGGEWWLEGGILWWWSVLVVWIVALAAIYAARFWQGKWKQMRVIEPPVEDLAANTSSGEGRNGIYSPAPPELAATGTDR
jgi:MATE family multidrug resistance protein